jgi:phosphoribosylformylglycinamidine cyclo-ligase
MEARYTLRSATTDSGMPNEPKEITASPRYSARGVSAEKHDVHRVVDQLDPGLFPGSFCKIIPDALAGDSDYCNVIHADGSGTKSILAYLQYRETGDPTVFEGISQDSIVMNLDDLLCIGATQGLIISNTLNRNARHCPGEVISALIRGSERFIDTLRDLGIGITPGGGETADVGDLTGTITVDSNAVARLRRDEVIGNRIQGACVIVGLSSSGQATYEAKHNSGVGSNGLTSARHDLLSSHYRAHYPETYDPHIPAHLCYSGPFRLSDPLPRGQGETVGEAMLSPTRTYAPLIDAVLRDYRPHIRGLIHCSGGGQTKCLKFGHGVHIIKDQLFTPPPIFDAIQSVSQTPAREMYQVFNMGHRMEIYTDANTAEALLDIASHFNVEAKIIGRTEPSTENRLTLNTPSGETILYQ